MSENKQKIGPKVDERRVPNPQLAPQPVYAARTDGKSVPLDLPQAHRR